MLLHFLYNPFKSNAINPIWSDSHVIQFGHRWRPIRPEQETNRQISAFAVTEKYIEQFFLWKFFYWKSKNKSLIIFIGQLKVKDLNWTSCKQLLYAWNLVITNSVITNFHYSLKLQIMFYFKKILQNCEIIFHFKENLEKM